MHTWYDQTNPQAPQRYQLASNDHINGKSTSHKFTKSTFRKLDNAKCQYIPVHRSSSSYLVNFLIKKSPTLFVKSFKIKLDQLQKLSNTRLYPRINFLLILKYLTSPRSRWQNSLLSHIFETFHKLN